MQEIWKNINGFEDYQISNLGRIKSLKFNNEKILQQSLNTSGYLQITLYKNKNIKSYSIHRLVAMHFIENLKNKPDINHISGIKTDNNVENLEWVTKSENTQHAYDTGLKTAKKEKHNKLSIPIKQYDLQGVFVKRWECIAEINRVLNISNSGICNCCKGKRDTAGGFVWRYADDISMVNKHNDARNRNVNQYDRQGNFIKEWDSIAEAGKALKVNYRNICEVCRNRKKTAYGFIWRYKDGELNAY